MYYSASSFLDKNLTPLERIYRIWYVLFSLRICRTWIIRSKSYTLAANFVTLNVYLCVEINAHAFFLYFRQNSDQKPLDHGLIQAKLVKVTSEA